MTRSKPKVARPLAKAAPLGTAHNRPIMRGGPKGCPRSRFYIIEDYVELLREGGLNILVVEMRILLSAPIPSVRTW